MSSIEQLNNVTTQITIVLSATCIALGIVGDFLNLAILTRPSFRSNSCSFYFLAATCVNLFVVLVILPFRILVGGFNIDPTVYNEPFCKIQIYCFSVIRALAIWFIALSCADRFFCSSSNNKLRALSSIKVARRAICICAVVIFAVYIHVLIYFKIGLVPNQFDQLAPPCVALHGFYSTFSPLWNLVWYALLPSFFMLLFGFLTMANIRQMRPQIFAQNQQPQTQQKKNRINNQLLKMLLIQVITILLTIIPFIVCRLRMSFIANAVKTQYEVAQDNLFLQVVTVISLISHSISFYLFTLSGPIFRRELIQIIVNRLIARISLHKVQPEVSMVKNLQNYRPDSAQQM
ncbi:unnamed protein product [Rotaria sp. Silwood1]|nr:unnamed protein product [Rotaria sp. Silwood1]